MIEFSFNKDSVVAVTSRSFSLNPELRAELQQRYMRVRFNDEGLKFSEAGMIDFLQGADKAITALETINETVLRHLPTLKVIGKYGVGLDMLDLRAMERYGVRLGWTPGVNRRSVAELALSFMLSLLHRAPEAQQMMRRGEFKQLLGGQLSGRTVGIVGLGHVGKDLALLLRPFGCRILANDILPDYEFCQKQSIEVTSLELLLRQSDVVTLHVPLTTLTRNLLNAEKLALLKPGAVLLNTARGGLVDELTLKHRLKAGSIAAAGLDVFALEPPTDQELINLPNVLTTTHIGGSAIEAVLEMGRAAIRGLDEHAGALTYL